MDTGHLVSSHSNFFLFKAQSIVGELREQLQYLKDNR